MTAAGAASDQSSLFPPVLGWEQVVLRGYGLS